MQRTDNPPSAVLILGARGRFGLAAARAFARSGWRVLAHARPGAVTPALPGVEWLHATLDDPTALAARAQGVQVVVHALNPPYSHRAWKAQAPGMLRWAIDISRALGATLMLPGNVYNFGDAMPPVLFEGTAQSARGEMGRLRIELEQALQEATADGRMRAVVIRAGDFFGSGAGSWLDLALAKDLRRGRVTLPGARDVATPWAYLPDLATTFARVASRRAQLASFETLHFAGHCITGDQWVEVLTDLAWENGWLPVDRKLRVSGMPWPLLRVAGVFAPTLGALADMAYLWRTPHRLDNRRLLALIGEEVRTPLAQAVGQSLADLGWTVAPGCAGALAVR